MAAYFCTQMKWIFITNATVRSEISMPNPSVVLRTIALMHWPNNFVYILTARSLLPTYELRKDHILRKTYSAGKG
jgi:hypothetical protein